MSEIEELKDKLSKCESRLYKLEILATSATKDMLSVEDCCKLYGTSKRFLYTNKHIPKYKYAGRIFFKREEIDEYISECKVDSYNDTNKKLVEYLKK